METLNPLDLDFWIRVGVSMLCGAVIGLERQLRGKPVGIRTSTLIVLGTAIFVQLGAAFPSEHADPTRVLGQVVTGIGFLGAGGIMARGDLITGITSAATIWMMAAIGSMVGLGHYLAAMALSLVTVLTLVGFEKVVPHKVGK
mgnify:CR=1 FL=1